MKTGKNFISSLIFTSLIILIVSSCKKDNVNGNKYLVSADKIVTYKVSYMNELINAAAEMYPDLNDIKQLVSQDIDIYKIKYNTEVGSQSIIASGLVCVPTKSGQYPVLSFQNGTNTVNEYCPSEYVANPAYQFVEAIASMGYVVVIPDYPGFGASSDIPHPYLILEPTVRSIIDMFYALREMDSDDLPDISIKNEFYLAGYSQGGWATLALHKAMEQDYTSDFVLKGSVCGAGPYDMSLLFNQMTGSNSYPMPVYIGYIINSYSYYNQFTNPVSDILKEPYATRLSGLYNGLLDFDMINAQLTTSVPDLFTTGFLSGFGSDIKYSSIVSALQQNSITGWKTSIPLLLVHGGGDTSVNPLTTESLYNQMIQAGTSEQICKKEILPELDHGDAVIPAMVKGLLFLLDLYQTY